MTKQEQIEEMAKIVDEMYNVYTTTADDIAEGLYNAGYRKVPFDIRHCFNEIEMKMKFKTDFGTIDFTEEQILFIEQAICWEEEKIRKKAAKEILQCLYDKCYEIQNMGRGGIAHILPIDILQLAKHYRVEVEE